MSPGTMKKHRSKQRNERTHRRDVTGPRYHRGHMRRYHPKLINQDSKVVRIQCRLEEIKDQVNGNQEIRDVRRTESWLVITDGKHGLTAARVSKIPGAS